MEHELTPGEVDLDWGRLWRLITSDGERYTHHLATDAVAGAHDPRLTLVSGLRALVMCQGFQATAVHRIGHALVVWRPRTAAGRAARVALRAVHWALNRQVESATGISIAERAVIGPGLHISHFGGVVIGQVRLGAHCNLSPRVTIGRGRRSSGLERPELGDRCWVGPGAVIVGGLIVGDDAVIGANAVVTRSVPARALAVGSPLAVLPERPSFDQVFYPGFEVDPARSASLSAHERATESLGPFDVEETSAGQLREARCTGG